MGRAPIILVVNADDFGLSKGINKGILSSFQQGILRSTSLMPNGQAFDDAVEIARSTPGLGVGIHISLVDEHCVAPVEDVRGLVGDDGRLPASYGAFVKALAFRRFGLKELRAEIEAQVQRVFDVGLMPTHIDSHQHLHMLPGVLDIVRDIARKYKIRRTRLPLECSWSIKARVLSPFCKRAIRRLRTDGILFPDYFWGLSCSGNMNQDNLFAILGSLKPGINEIMVHPGFSDPETSARYQWGYNWEGEVAALRSAAIRAQVELLQLRLASFADA